MKPVFFDSQGYVVEDTLLESQQWVYCLFDNNIHDVHSVGLS